MILEKTGFWLIIVVSIMLFSCIMIIYPYGCNEISMLSGGLVSCGLNIGAYLLAIFICVVAAAAAIMLIE